MKKAQLPWKPWHQVVSLRDDLRSGELPLHLFAADLHDVLMQSGKRPVYEQPEQFFALTYPTYNLRQLVRDVVLRVAGRNDKAVRQLELTYGGGKTHTLITLRHLVTEPDRLPDLPAVKEFVAEIGQAPPRARVAGLCFDKLDVEKGMEVRAPDGQVRLLKQPWSVLAYQIAGDQGLELLHAENRSEERDSAPAENLLIELLELPVRQDHGVLILIDEVLMYVREKVALDGQWRSRIVNFFQYLTQAATKVDRCCIVASLLASDPAKSDGFGRQLQGELYDIFQRQREAAVEPVAGSPRPLLGTGEETRGRIASAELEPAEIQELGDLIPRLLEIKAKSGVPIRFHVQIELGDGKSTLSDQVIQKIERLLNNIQEGFGFNR